MDRHGFAPEDKLAVQHLSRAALGLVEKNHTGGVDGAPVVEGAIVMYIMVTGDHHTRHPKPAEPPQHLGHDAVIEPLMIKEVTNDQHGVNLVSHHHLFNGDQRTEAMIVMVARLWGSIAAPDVHIGGVKEANWS